MSVEAIAYLLTAFGPEPTLPTFCRQSPQFTRPKQFGKLMKKQHLIQNFPSGHVAINIRLSWGDIRSPGKALKGFSDVELVCCPHQHL